MLLPPFPLRSSSRSGTKSVVYDNLCNAAATWTSCSQALTGLQFAAVRVFEEEEVAHYPKVLNFIGPRLHCRRRLLPRPSEFTKAMWTYYYHLLPIVFLVAHLDSDRYHFQANAINIKHRNESPKLIRVVFVLPTNSQTLLRHFLDLLVVVVVDLGSFEGCTEETLSQFFGCFSSFDPELPGFMYMQKICPIQTMFLQF